MIYCPECETNLDIDEEEVDEGEIVSCPECGSDFEIVTVNPIELKPVEEAVLDEEAIWEWGVVERVSTGLLGTRVAMQPVARQMLEAAERIAG